MFDKTKTHELLRGVKLFEGLDDATLRRISSQFKLYSFPAGSSVIAEDSSGRFGRMYVVVSGTASAHVHDDVVANYGPGDSFGEMSALDGQPRSAGVVADTDLETLGLSAWNMRALLREEPDVALHVIQVLTSRLRAANEAAHD